MTVPTIAELFTLAAQRSGDRIAVRDSSTEISTEISYAELARRVARSAQRMRRELATTGGDRVVIMAGNQPDYLVAVLACATAGLVAVPINAQLRPREIAHVVTDSAARLVLVGPEQREVVQRTLAGLPVERDRPALVDLRDLAAGGPSTVDAPDRYTVDSWHGPSEGDLLYLGYTSGTTGAPKGVKVTHRNRARAIFLQAAEFQLGRDDTHLVVSPLYHTAPLTFALLHLCLGGTVTLAAKFDAEQVAVQLGSSTVTNTFLAPAALRRVLARLDPAAPLPDELHTVIVGGAPCPVDVKNEALAKLPGRLYEFYGATEVGIVTSLRPHEQATRPGSAGRPFPGARVEVRDLSTGTVLPAGRTGGVWVRTATMSDGYFGANGTEPGAWSFLGDLGYTDEEGYLHLVDRTADVIISGGVNVYSREVETVLEGHPAVVDVAVFGIADEEWGEAVAAAVVTRDGVTLTADELVRFCRDRLASYKLPRTVVFLPSLPRSETGKTDKRSLRSRLAATDTEDTETSGVAT